MHPSQTSDTCNLCPASGPAKFDTSEFELNQSNNYYLDDSNTDNEL